MNPFPLPPGPLVAVLRTVAALGAAAALLGLVAGWLLLGRTAAALEASLALTDDTLEALDASAGVADDAVAALAASLSALESTAADLDATFDDGERLLVDLAEVVREDVVSSVRAIDDSLPGVVAVAGTIDATLSTLSTLPFGPAYDPERSFAASLGELSTSLSGLPDRLADQADLIEASGANLAAVGSGVQALAAEIASFDDALGQTAALLATYDETIQEGRAVVEAAQADLVGQVRLARAAVVFGSLAFLAMQVVPLQMAAMVEREVDRRGPRSGRRRGGAPEAGGRAADRATPDRPRSSGRPSGRGPATP